MHLVRHPENTMGYVGVHNSESLQQFGEQQMSKPGPRANLTTRTFFDMKPEEVLSRKKEVGQVRTLVGIKSKYNYICLPDGEVMWRRYPCCCLACLDLRWGECSVPELVGKLETVVQSGATLYSSRSAGNWDG